MNTREKDTINNRTLFRSLVGKSLAMKNIRHEIEQVADSNANVLIMGGSGTGKEVVARNVHYNSKRRNKPFVPVNCGAIPHDLLESELFGHEKGAFTGAITARLGRFSMAEGGTLFLDEIGEMAMAMQVKLLRVLEERIFERVGGTKSITADVRIVAATNKNLEEMVAQGGFREDLFFRLDVFPIGIPALRERKEDIPLLINELISRLENSGRGSVRFNAAAIMAMSQFDWPGNVRELSNQIERMAIKFPNGLVQISNLPEKIKNCVLQGNNIINLNDVEVATEMENQPLPNIQVTDINFSEDFDLKSYISNIEVSIIENALDNSSGVIAHAAKLLGLQRTTLAEKMRKYHINRSHSVTGIAC